MSYELRKPITDKQRVDFIVQHQYNYEIVDTELFLFALEPNEIMGEKEVEIEGETILIPYPVIDPDYEEKEKQKEKERIAKLSLTRREVFLALFDAKGITPEVLRSQITDPRALIEFDYAEKYFRFNPLINTIGAQLGYTPEDLDYLFVNKEFPQNEEEQE